ncbi:MAG: hypothetical protein GY754_38605 [bacterium]|nr:hypothetical protein [bacterium]
MPTYEYECLECEHRFDVFQSIKDDPVSTCEKCGKEVRKVYGTTGGIIFKGSGFYVNDYKKAEAGASSGPPCQGNPNNPACGSCKSAV